MAQLVSIDDYFLVMVDGRLNGQQDLFTMHYRVTAIELSDDVPYEAFCIDFNTAIQTGGWAPPLADIQSVDFKYIRFIIQKIHPVRLVAQYFPPTLEQGNIVEPALPQNVSLAITLRGDIADRSDIATKKIGGIPDTSVLAGNVVPGVISDLETLGDFLLTPFDVVSGGNTITIAPVIFHRDNPATFTPVTTRLAGRTSRIMRRRTVGVGS